MSSSSATAIIDYIRNCNQNESDWDIDNMADAIDAYMDAHDLTSAEDIPEDDWNDFFRLFDVSGDSEIVKGAHKFVITQGEWNGGYYKFDVQHWTPTSHGWAYTGDGKYCRDKREVADYILEVA